MAKKLNKKVAIIGIVLVGLIIAGGIGMFLALKIHRSPGRALRLFQKALEAGDYLEAENQIGRAYVFGKTDEFKIERLFDLAELHLIQNDRHQADWNKAMGCWSKIVSIDPENMKARRALLDFYYQAADAGDSGSWRYVRENTTEMIETLRTQGAEPEPFILTAHTKALLSIALRGETTDRRTPLDECITILTELLEKESQSEELYLLMANAETVNGELNTLAGMMDAKAKARQKAIEVLESGIEQSDDKATAAANLILYKMQTAGNDPNSVEAIRAEIEQRSKQVQPNDKLWSVTSIAYETHGKMSEQAELNRAIEAIRKSQELKPEDFEYTLRMAKLMYRKGNAFNDPAAIDDALKIAEDALTMQEVQDLPGPLRGRNVNYRFALNNFLAELYLEKAMAAKDADDSVGSEDYIKKAQDRIDEMVSVLGTTDSPRALKYQGLVALAKGQRDQAIRALYKSYEQDKALDKEGELSNVDARVSVVLAQIAAQLNEPGLQAEFMRTALSSRDRYIAQKPELILDYADILNQLRNFSGWAEITKQLAENYQSRFGANDLSRQLVMEATLAMGQLDQAEELLSTFEDSPAQQLNYELSIILNRIGQFRRSAAGPDEEDTEAAPEEQNQELEQLYARRNSLLAKLLQEYPKEVNPSRLSQICRNLIRNDQADIALNYLDSYLAATPNVLNLMQLRLLARQEDPLNLTEEQQQQLREQAIDSLSDEKQKAILKSEQFRMQAEYEKALQVLEQNPDVDPKDPDIIIARFDVVLDQKDLKAAENLQQIIRKENLDRSEGNLAAARIEIVKENYELALRRLDECIKLRPLFSYTYFIKSQVQRQLEDIEGAITSARTSIRMNPQNGAYARNLASLLFTRNADLGSKVTVEQQQEAERAIAFAMALNPTDWQLQSVFAESIQLQAPDQALAIRQRLLETYPTAANALMLGNMSLRMATSEWDAAKKTGLIELAGKAYQQGMEIAPDNEPLRQAYADYLSRTRQNEKAIDLLGDDQNLLWKFYLRNGQFEQAQAILKELNEKSPDDSLLVQGLVLVTQALGERDDFKRYLDRLSELEQTKDTELWILQKYLDNGFAVEAETKLASFKERYPDEKSILLIEAWTAMGKGRLDEALALSNRYLETDTNNAGAWRLRGRIYRLLNQPRKAVDDLQRSKSLKDTPEVRIELATVYVEMDQVTAAIGELVSSLEDPQAPQTVRLMLEGLYKMNNRTADLEKFYTAMTEKYPENPYWYLRAGTYYLDQKDLSRSQALSQKALDLSVKAGQPSSGALQCYLESLFLNEQYDKIIATASGYVDGPLAYIAYGYLAQVQVRLNQPEKAIGSFNKALDKAGMNDAVLEGVIRIMLQTVGEKAVTAWIDRQLAADSTALPAHLAAAGLAQMKGSYNQAIEHLDQCIEKAAPNSGQWMAYTLKKVNLLLMAYAKTTDQDYFGRASDLLTELLEIQPNNASLLNNLAYLLVDNDRQLEKALDYARRAHQQEPGNAVYLDTYAYAQCKAGQYEQAEQNLIRALQLYEVSGQAVPWDLYEHFGMAKEGLGKTAEAIEMYQKAIDVSGQIPETEKQQLQEAIQRLQQI